MLEDKNIITYSQPKEGNCPNVIYLLKENTVDDNYLQKFWQCQYAYGVNAFHSNKNV